MTKRLKIRKLRPGEKLKEARNLSPNVMPAPQLADFLQEDTRKRLDAFCEAHHGADPRVVIESAVNDFISLDLAKNDEANRRYNKL